jgi:formylmethanofuran dehydrogenase subunit D
LPRISFGSLSEDAAISELAEAASAGPDYRKQLRILIDYMLASGLIQREGDQLKRATNGTSSASEVIVPLQKAEISKPTEFVPEVQNKGRVVTAFTQSTEGAVHFNVSVRVEMAEFAGWKPERISAFFSGIAEVLAAKANIEKDAGN